MADIKMTLEDGTVIEGSAEDIAEMSTLLGKAEEGDDGNAEKTETRQAKDEEDSSEPVIKAGDKVKVIHENMSFGNYEVSDILTVKRVCSDGYFIMEEFDEPIVFPSEVEFHPRGNIGEFSEGDVVELMYGGEGDGMSGIPSGDRLKVIAETGGVMGYQVKSLTSKTVGYVSGSKLRRIESKTSDSQKIKVGDKVILRAGDKENRIPLQGMYNGNTYEVKSDGGEGLYWVSNGESCNGGYATSDQLILVDDRRGKEVVEVGDIARVTEFSCGFPVGTIGEVVKVFDGSIRVRMEATGDNRDGEKDEYYEKNVKLVAREGDRYDR